MVKDIFPADTLEFMYTCEEDVLNIAVKENITVNIVKTKQQYIVTFVNNGVEEKISLEYGADIKAYIVENYIPEEGYYLDYTTTHDVVPGNNNARVELTYKPNMWVLSYTTTGAGEKDINGEKEVAFGSSIMENLPSTELEGFDFGGWFNGENKVSEADTMPNGNFSVNGIYEIMSFIVIVKDGQTEVLNKEYTYGTKLQVVLDDIKEYRENLYNEGYETNVNIEAEDIIKSAMEIKIERTEREFELIFKNVEEIISASTVKVGSIIKYPDMSARTEHDVEYVFVWEDDSYNGEPMPARNLTIVGSYQEKAVAPIYFGSYVTPVSVYSEDNISRFYDETKLDTSYYDSIEVSKCVGGGSVVTIFMPGYEPFADLSDRQANKECKNYYQPPVFIIPISVVEKYSISILDGIGTNEWPNFITDNNVINIDGNEYYFYSRIPNDTLTPGKYDNGDMKVTIKLTEK